MSWIKPFIFTLSLSFISALYAAPISRGEYTNRLESKSYIAVEVFEDGAAFEKRSFAIVSIKTPKVLKKTAYLVSTGDSYRTPQGFFTLGTYIKNIQVIYNRGVSNFFSFVEYKGSPRIGLFTESEISSQKLGTRTTRGGIRFSLTRGGPMLQSIGLQKHVRPILAVYGDRNPARPLTSSDIETLNRDLYSVKN